MIIDALAPNDAPELIRLANIWGEPSWTISPGAHGIVVRDGEHVPAFGLLRETPHGFVIDEIREEPTFRGIRALSILADWIEHRAQQIATERGTAVSLGGICRLDNPQHYRALEKRGFATVAHVLAKDYTP